MNEYTYDDALQFRAVTIFTPNIFHEADLGRLPLPVLPKTTLTVTLKDGSTRSHVVDWSKTANKVEGNVQVTIYEMGLTDADGIASYSITYEMEDGSKLNGRLGLQTEPLFDIKDGARGTFKRGVAFVPTLADGTTYRRTSTEVTDLVGARQVTVVEKPVSNPVVLATVEFMKKDGNVVAVGDNQVHVRMFNNTNSNDNLDKQISSTVLLPYGVKVKSDPNASYKIDSLRFGRQQYPTPGHFSILDENYNGTGQQLVHIDWDQTTLLPWQRADAYFDVEITKNSPDQPPLTMWGKGHRGQLRLRKRLHSGDGRRHRVAGRLGGRGGRLLQRLQEPQARRPVQHGELQHRGLSARELRRRCGSGVEACFRGGGLVGHP